MNGKPATHSQPSRKGKKAWRKNVDLEIVESGLERVRQEIIQTGGVITEKPENELFATDTAGDHSIGQKLKGKELKCDEILKQRSAVPGLDGRKRKVPPTPTPSDRYKRGNYVPHRELTRLRNVADGGVEVQVEEHVYDPWAEQEAPADGFVAPVRPKVEPKTLKRAPLPLTADGKGVRDVLKPSASKSYNPAYPDWQASLQREGAAAVEAESARLRAEAEQKEKEARARAEAERVEQWEREDDEYGTEWEGFETEDEQPHTTKQPRRKTPAERTKIKARKLREAEERGKKKQKMREAEEQRIAQIAKEVRRRQLGDGKDRAENGKNLTENGEEEDKTDEVVLQKRRFGRLPVPEAPLEVQLTEDLTDSLRRLRPEGNLLTDRYRNALINGKLEVRKRRDREQHKQAKKTRTEKWSYKDWTLR
ncbi:P60-like protein [Piedraia hortae CBS 480.64]|uniref:Ribosome biogenesis protein NOP53 n=1 Tax=Piedraia hortae CBS 480.64 TaxID=1314780 RepID=A0A6A7BVC7_9PEZI|nr:P60-like protein [Piedraia hortae CBS 480.64]